MRVEVGVNFGTNAGYMKRFKVLNADQYRAAIKKYNQPATFDYGGNEDALKRVTQAGLSQNYSLAFSGGNEVGKFRASFPGLTYRGIFKEYIS
jgi:iron complex outermembrane receptor protein